MNNPEIIYVNGIHTKYKEALRQAEAIEKFCGRHVFLFHNPSATWTSSLVESLWNRWFHWIRPAPIVKRFASFIERSLTEDVLSSSSDRIKGSSSGELHESASSKFDSGLHILAHSQGTAIANNAVNLLPDNLKGRISMTLFAPVNSFTVQGVNTVDRFINEKDYVLSSLIKINKTSGYDYIRDGKGHSFIKSYFNKLREFTGYEASMFWGLKEEE